MFKVLLFIVLILFISCTSVRYTSNGKIPLALTNRSDHLLPKEVTGRKKFYLWGLYPKKHTVLIDKKLTSITLSSASKVSVEEYQTFSDFVYMIISFGMYVPVSYKITCLGIKDD